MDPAAEAEAKQIAEDARFEAQFDLMRNICRVFVPDTNVTKLEKAADEQEDARWDDPEAGIPHFYEVRAPSQGTPPLERVCACNAPCCVCVCVRNPPGLYPDACPRLPVQKPNLEAFPILAARVNRYRFYYQLIAEGAMEDTIVRSLGTNSTPFSRGFTPFPR